MSGRSIKSEDNRGNITGVVIENFDEESKRSEVSQEQFALLFKLNLAAAVFQLVTGLAILFLLDEDKTYAVYSNFPLVDEDAEGNPFQAGPDPNKLFSLSTGYLAGVFLLLSALDHFLVCSIFKGTYEKGLRANYNIFRWIEYSISASIMHILVGLLSGISDIQMLLLIFGLTACTMLFGLVFELDNSGRPINEVKWYSFWIGFVPHAFCWTVILWYFFRNVSQGDPPAFVWSINIIIFFLDLTFALVLGLQWRGKGKWKDYIRGEFAFIILSFTSKQLLAWINFQGGNR